MTTTTLSPICIRARRLNRGLAVLAATGATYTVWAVTSWTGVDLPLKDGTTVGPLAVVGTTLVVGLLAWALRAVLERFTANARTAWTWIAGVVLALSLAGPVTSAATGATAVALIAMHLAAAAVLIPLISRRR